MIIFSGMLAPISGFFLIFSDNFINILCSWNSNGFRQELLPFFIYWGVLLFALINIHRYKKRLKSNSK
jgi:hypothetical protein